MRRAITTALAVFVLFALTSPAFAGENGNEADRTITVEATEFEFTPDEITVEAETTVKIKFVNKGSVAHSYDIKKLDVASEKILADETTTVTFTPKKPGDYQFVCDVPGHKKVGMKGTLHVEKK